MTLIFSSKSFTFYSFVSTSFLISYTKSNGELLRDAEKKGKYYTFFERFFLPELLDVFPSRRDGLLMKTADEIDLEIVEVFEILFVILESELEFFRDT